MQNIFLAEKVDMHCGKKLGELQIISKLQKFSWSELSSNFLSNKYWSVFNDFFTDAGTLVFGIWGFKELVLASDFTRMTNACLSVMSFFLTTIAVKHVHLL